MGGGPKEQKTTTTTNENTTQKMSGSSSSDYSGATSGAQATDINIPEWLKPFVTQSTGVAGTALTGMQDAVNGYQLPPEVLEGLQATAQGDYLFGGQGFNEAVSAAQRAAMPGILSTFGGAGRGTGGLAQTAIAQGATDAFARLFGDERARQMQAFQLLPELNKIPIELQQQLLGSAAALPGAFSPLFGSRGTTSGTTSGNQNTKSSSVIKGTSSGTSVQTQPIYETPWWQTALGAGAAIAGIPTGGGLAGGTLAGSLLGAFR